MSIHVVPAVPAVPVIPAVRHVDVDTGTPAPGDTVRIHSGTPVVVLSHELLGAAHRFVADVQRDADVALAGVRQQPGHPTDTAVTLFLGDERLADLPRAAGVRADGTDGDERHGVQITAAGVRVWGTTPEAVHRGLTTVRQLITAAASEGTAVLERVRVLDAPRFAWRGLSLDVARTFHDVDTVRRVVDMLSLYKLNVLHLHLTDDQGWRVEVPGWPLLTEIGGAGATGDRPGGHYTRADVTALVRYAAERFVTLVPEVDMPGHASAVFHAYPELAPVVTDGGRAAAGVSIGNLDPDHGPTLRFVDEVVAAVAAQFSTSAFVHIGGDETFGMPDEAHARFVDHAMAAVKRHGRRVVGWQEIARAGVGPDDLVQYWIEPESVRGHLADGTLTSPEGPLAGAVPADLLPLITQALTTALDDVPRAVSKGAPILASPSTRLYLDRPHGEPSTDVAQDLLRGRVGLQYYPAVTLREFVEWDPVDETPQVDDDAGLAGVEAAVWCETVEDRDELEFLLLPRLAGVGEKAWAASGATTWDDYADRLAAQPVAWERRGWVWFRSSLVAWRTFRDVPGA
ncbi:family 20 glycosylhydrolase [Streptomyces sp. NPDC058171]